MENFLTIDGRFICVTSRVKVLGELEKKKKKKKKKKKNSLAGQTFQGTIIGGGASDESKRGGKVW